MISNMEKPLMLRSVFYLICLNISLGSTLFCQEIPLPEHPRPDFERKEWINLNGVWNFQFDSVNAGIRDQWYRQKTAFNQQIMVPFPWGSKLSRVEDNADIGWYQRDITVPDHWKGKRTFLTIGASDWETTIWLDGKLVGKHQGGYVPFSFELTDMIETGKTHRLVIRVDDARRDFTLYGKQGYGNARGIWQTVYLEARGPEYIEALHFTPDIDEEKVKVTVYLPEKTVRDLTFNLEIRLPSSTKGISETIPKGKIKYLFEIPLPQPKLWSMADPFLYHVKATLAQDEVHTYFGMRKISVVNLPGTEYPYIALNDQPVYLQLALDQSYHPEGYYTFPSDKFMKEEIERSKSIGLNGIRIHIKVEVPRKLYWADKLGLLVMEDLPNSWGEPDQLAQKESEYTLREMIKRDYNHPSIFSWVAFNETWGLRTKVTENGKTENKYLPETQHWVASMYYLAKSLDPTRLVEDNSICCGRGHVETDINSWHAYKPGWEWEELLKEITENTYEGSSYHFENGFKQGNQPNINSECGNVWGYAGSTGDVDWSWDYHRMINTFRMYPKVAGWLYTEHHDVINEWNGYWRYDRTEKETGLEMLNPGMQINDFHAPVYLSTGNEICVTHQIGEPVQIPLFLSVMTGHDYGKNLQINYSLMHANYIGETEKNLTGTISVIYKSWMQQSLDPLVIKLPEVPGLAILRLEVTSENGETLHRNFMHFEIKGSQEIEKVQTASISPLNFADANWNKKQWDVLEGKKVNGAGSGFFTYRIEIPRDLAWKGLTESYFLAELSAKELFVKDQQEYQRNQDFMKGSRVAPSGNPNSYPMTDQTRYPSEISIWIDGQKKWTTTLQDDPADHQGVLSWHHQLKDRKLREAGSYGYLVKVPISKSELRRAIKRGFITVKLQTEGEGGIAIYGKNFGKYPFDPSIVVKLK